MDYKKFLLVGLCLPLMGCNPSAIPKFGEYIGLAKFRQQYGSDHGTHINVPAIDPAIAQEFAYVSNAQLQEINLVDTTSNYYWLSAKLTAKDKAHETVTADGTYSIKIDFFISRKAGTEVAPLVVQLPPLGSDPNVQEVAGKYFASQGMHSMAVYPDHNAVSLDQTVDNMGNYFIRNTIAIQQALDFVLRATEEGKNIPYFPPYLPRIDSNQIFSFGISLGGMRNVYLLAVEPRICHGTIVMGGADLSSVIAHSREPAVVKYRNHWTQKLLEAGKIPDGSELSFETYLRGVFKIDTLSLAEWVPSHKASQVISKNDTVVATDRQIQLWQALGEPAMATASWPYYDLIHFPEKWPLGHFDIAFVQNSMLKFAVKEFNGQTCNAILK